MHERMFTDLGLPIHVAIMETPAGFELNSALVAENVGDFLKTKLINFSPDVSIIPARNRDWPFSTNNPEILAPMLDANYLFLGAGSPTYLASHLKDSLSLRYLIGRHRKGATLCLASASAMAAGSKVVPVYEIFKAGHDLHWMEGLDLFGAFGLDLAIVSHWDNNEGGAHLDTSHCFMGKSRMDSLMRLLDDKTRVLGIDEHTGVVFDFDTEMCHVMGKGKATVLSSEVTEVYETGAEFPMQILGPYHLPSSQVREYGSPVVAAREERSMYILPSQGVLTMLQQREMSRQARNWSEADEIRKQVFDMGFDIHDTPEGPKVTVV
jgi:cyanophycinase-like exopeptidase